MPQLPRQHHAPSDAANDNGRGLRAWAGPSLHRAAMRGVLCAGEAPVPQVVERFFQRVADAR